MDDLLIGRQLGNYRIESVIGRGGMATVYYAFDVSLHRPVAVKAIDARYQDSPAFAERFLQEARTVSTWRHENILQVYHTGREDEFYFFAMEFVDGADLGKVMKQYAADEQLMLHEDVLEIGFAVAKALNYAHNQGVIHRDVKPSNVMVARDGRIILADFGLALDVVQGSIGDTFGSPHYIAPEQARSSSMAVPQSDIYALGTIMYELLTGSVPFDDLSPASVAIQHLTQPPPEPRRLNPKLNQATEKVLLKSLSKRPEDRYQTATGLIEGLAEALQVSDPAAGAESLPSSPPSKTAPVPSQASLEDRVSQYILPLPVNEGELAKMIPGTDLPPNDSTPTVADKFVTSISAVKKKPLPLPWIAIGVLIILLPAAGCLLFTLGGKDETETAGSDISPTTVASGPAEPTEGDVLLLPSPVVVPTGTAEFEPTESKPNELPAAEATETLIHEPTKQPAEVVPTDESTSIPSGPRLIMFYDPTSFYVYNPNREMNIRVSDLTFESLDENGELSGYWFDGRRWSQYYSFLESLGCASLEITQADSWLRPSQCRIYNASITPDQNSDSVFWNQRTNVTQFQVLWQGQEIGRCEVAANECEAFLP